MGVNSMVKNEVTTNISIRHQCLTVMDFYANKSIEVSWISLKRAFPNSQNIFCLVVRVKGYIGRLYFIFNSLER